MGHGDSETVLAAHQNLLLESPFLAESIAKLGESTPVSRGYLALIPKGRAVLTFSSDVFLCLTKMQKHLAVFYNSSTLMTTLLCNPTMLGNQRRER